MLSLPSWCARAEQVPANPVRAARLRPALCALQSAGCRARLRAGPPPRLGAGSPPPLSAEGTPRAKTAACWLPAGMRTPAVTSAFARREHSYRARRAAGSAEVDDQAQNVRWRNPACCHRAAMRIIIGRGGSEASGGGRRRAGLPAERSCPPGTDRLAPGLDLADLDQITPTRAGAGACLPRSAARADVMTPGERGGGAAHRRPAMVRQRTWAIALGDVRHHRCRAERSFPGRRRLTGDELAGLRRRPGRPRRWLVTAGR